MINQIIHSINYGELFSGLKLFWNALPVWLPIFSFSVFLVIWLRYIRTDFILKQGSMLLEIKLPKEVNKTPLAMEIILTSLVLGGKGEFITTFVTGKTRPWFSLELVSLGGEVHFFVWTQKKFKKLIETQFYAQYPGVELYEVDDYTKNVFRDPEKLSMWGIVFGLTKPDVYPIKTYVDYGLDKVGVEEEYKIDPMTSVLEFLGSVKRGEQIWIQILIQAHRKNTIKDDAHAKVDWKDAGKAEIKKKIDEIKGKDEETRGRAPTPGEKDVISALERSLTKFPFEVGIRGLYIAKKELFDGINITGLIGSFRQYNSESLNGFKLGKITTFDNPWQDFKGMRKAERERKILNAYKLRSYFQTPYKHLLVKPFILNTEELATIFHIPGSVAGTPTLSRSASKKGQPPANLPI